MNKIITNLFERQLKSKITECVGIKNIEEGLSLSSFHQIKDDVYSLEIRWSIMPSGYMYSGYRIITIEVNIKTAVILAYRSSLMF